MNTLIYFKLGDLAFRIIKAMVAPELKQNTEDTEITKTCAVLGCEESKNLNSDSFFRFPEDPSFKQIWTDLTGRNNWTPTDYSYICVQHFSVDCFECDAHDAVVLNSKAVPSLKLPKHVLEVEYIDEDTFENEYEDNYYEEDQDYEMDNEVANNIENEEHLDEDYMSEEHIEEHNLSEDHITENHRQDVPQSKYLTNGNYNHTTMKPSTSNFDNITDKPTSKTKDDENLELLKLFTQVQKMQRRATKLKDKLKTGMRAYKRQSRCLARLKEEIDLKKNLLVQRRKKKSRILLSLQDKIREDTNGLVLAMPTRHTDDLKNFALSVYKYSPQAYIYIRNTLRTLLPSTDVLDSWVLSGYEAKNVLSSSKTVRVVSELTDTELSCKVSFR
ncbi:uncharacterized protein LOC120630032 isoform X2 [Pararge aegeria]|uniref:uncharacterized protein LOC120630032 isoform X2 n=1 Tax=Pararge aegeria TaxID=116150 RepID=UPI0019D21FAA|nr:uncharacterized protein LOC120630032 isoform X2 [Pararge aegeria]